jgi:O-antigen/teichoic acid export membrane protein
MKPAFFSQKMAERSPLGRIIANTAWLLAGKGFAAVLSLIYLAIVTRTLGVVGFGEFALITGAASLLATLIGFQSWVAVMRYGAHHVHGTPNPAALGRLIALAVTLDGLGALVGAAIAWAAIGELAPLFGWNPTLTNIALYFIIAILFAISSTPIAILRTHDRFDLTIYAEAAMPLVRLIGSLIILLSTPNIISFLLVWALSEVMVTIIAWGLVLKITKGVFVWQHFRELRIAWRENVDIGKFIGSTNLLSSLSGITRQLTTIMIGAYAGPAAAGLYRLAAQISNAMAKATQLLSRSVYAELTRGRAEAGGAGFSQLFRTTNRLALIGGVATLLLVIMLGRPAIALIAGDAFLAAYPLLILLAAAAAVELIGMTYEPTLLSGNGVGTALIIRAINFVTLLALLLLLLPRYGAMGGAAAVLLTALMAFIHFHFAARKHS